MLRFLLCIFTYLFFEDLDDLCDLFSLNYSLCWLVIHVMLLLLTQFMQKDKVVLGGPTHPEKTYGLANLPSLNVSKT